MIYHKQVKIKQNNTFEVEKVKKSLSRNVCHTKFHFKIDYISAKWKIKKFLPIVIHKKKCKIKNQIKLK